MPTTTKTSKPPSDEEVRHFADLLEWAANGNPWDYDPDALARSKDRENAYAQWVNWMSPAYVVGLLDRYDALKEQVSALEEKTREIADTTRILYMSRLVQDGHAPDWKSAVRMVREDFDGVVALYKGRDEESE